jgi:hypothetical protein
MCAQEVEQHRGIIIYADALRPSRTVDATARRYHSTIDDRTYSGVTIGELKAIIDVALTKQSNN